MKERKEEKKKKKPYISERQSNPKNLYIFIINCNYIKFKVIEI